MVLEAPQTCIRLHSHPGNGSEGNLGGLEEEDLLHSLWDSQAASVWKICRSRGEPGADPESCSSQHGREQGRRISIHLPSSLWMGLQKQFLPLHSTLLSTCNCDQQHGPRQLLLSAVPLYFCCAGSTEPSKG